MCGTGIIIQGRIVHESIFRKKALSGTEMIPKQYTTPLRHRKLVGLPMENWPLLGLYLTSGTIINPDLPNGNNCKLTLSGLKSLDFSPLFLLRCSILISSDKDLINIMKQQ
jgi:hypothetical protein